MGRLRGTSAGFLWLLVLMVTYSLDAYAFRIVSFNGQFTRWNREEIPYVIDSRGSKNFEGGCDSSGPCVSESEAIARSFAAWTNVPGVKIRFVEQGSKTLSATGYDKENDIIWVNNGWTQLPFTPPTAALAVTISTYKTSNKEIVDSDIHFNGEYFDWAVIDSPEEETANVVDIENIATHEIGHFFGLDHSSEKLFEPNQELYLATMFFASGPGEIFRRNLHDDDMEAAQNLYPSEDVVSPEVSSISPDKIDAYTSGTALVTIQGQNFLPNTAVVMATTSDSGDITGEIVSRTDTEMQVSFEIYGVPSGTYDIVVSNSFDRLARIGGAFKIEGGYGVSSGGESTSPTYGSSGGGGCDIDFGSDLSSFSATGLTAILLPLLLIVWARLQLVGRLRRREVPLKTQRGSLR